QQLARWAQRFDPDWPLDGTDSAALQTLDHPDLSALEPETAAALQHFVGLIVRDYVHSWFARINYSGVPEFPLACEGALQDMLLRLGQAQGRVETAAVVRAGPASDGGRDSLLLGFADAKFSLVQYDAPTGELVTASIHYYEREEFRMHAPLVKPPPVALVDPGNRCALMRFYDHQLAVLPLRAHRVRPAAVAAAAASAAAAAVAVPTAAPATAAYEPTQRMQLTTSQQNQLARIPYTSSFVMRMTALHPKLTNVVDMCFLPDYPEPTLAVLYATTATWAGRLAARKDTKNVMVLSLNLDQRHFSVLYEAQRLPWDAHAITPCPAPLGGVLVTATNAFVYVGQTCLPGVVCAVNPYYGLEHALPDAPALEQVDDDLFQDNVLYTPKNISDYKALGLRL
ncbi:hypothetical protein CAUPRSCDRAFT_12546, partial [Caulochytrium protostelioides]